MKCWKGEPNVTLLSTLLNTEDTLKQNKQNQSAGNNFKFSENSWSDMKVIGLGKVKSRETMYRKERLSYLIRKFNTFYKGMKHVT